MERGRFAGESEACGVTPKELGFTLGVVMGGMGKGGKHSFQFHSKQNMGVCSYCMCIKIVVLYMLVVQLQTTNEFSGVKVSEVGKGL